MPLDCAGRLQHFRHSRYTGSSQPVYRQADQRLSPHRGLSGKEQDDLRVPSSPPSPSNISRGSVSSSAKPRPSGVQQPAQGTGREEGRGDLFLRARGGHESRRGGGGGGPGGSGTGRRRREGAASSSDSSTERKHTVDDPSHPGRETIAPPYSRKLHPSRSCCPDFHSAGDLQSALQTPALKSGGVHTPQHFGRAAFGMKNRRISTAGLVVEPSSPRHFQRSSPVVISREREGERGREGLGSDVLPHYHHVAAGGDALRAVAFSRHGCSSSNSSKSDGTTDSDESSAGGDYRHHVSREVLLSHRLPEFSFSRVQHSSHGYHGVTRRVGVSESSNMKEKTEAKKKERAQQSEREMEKKNEKKAIGNHILQGEGGEEKRASVRRCLWEKARISNGYEQAEGERPEADFEGAVHGTRAPSFSSSFPPHESKCRDVRDASSEHGSSSSTVRVGPLSSSSFCCSLPPRQENSVNDSYPSSPSSAGLSSSSSSSSSSSLALRIGGSVPRLSTRSHHESDVEIDQKNHLPAACPLPPSSLSGFSAPHSSPNATRPGAASCSSVPPPGSLSPSFSLLPRSEGLRHPAARQTESQEFLRLLRPSLSPTACPASASKPSLPPSVSPEEATGAPYPAVCVRPMGGARGLRSSSSLGTPDTALHQGPPHHCHDDGLILPRRMPSRASNSTIPHHSSRVRTRRRCMLCCSVLLDISQSPSFSPLPHSASSSPRVASPDQRPLSPSSSFRTDRNFSVSSSLLLHSHPGTPHRTYNPSSFSPSLSYSLVNSRSSRTSQRETPAQSSSGFPPSCLVSLASRGCISFSFLIPLDQLRFYYPLPSSDPPFLRGKGQRRGRRNKALPSTQLSAKRAKGREGLPAEEGAGRWERVEEEEEEEPTPRWWRGRWLGKDVAIRVLTVSDLSSHLFSERIRVSVPPSEGGRGRQSSFWTTASVLQERQQRRRDSCKRVSRRNGHLHGDDHVPGGEYGEGHCTHHGARLSSFVPLERDREIKGGRAHGEEGRRMKEDCLHEEGKEAGHNAGRSRSCPYMAAGSSACPSLRSARGASVSFAVFKEQGRFSARNRKSLAAEADNETEDSSPGKITGAKKKKAWGFDEGGSSSFAEEETAVMTMPGGVEKHGQTRDERVEEEEPLSFRERRDPEHPDRDRYHHRDAGGGRPKRDAEDSERHAVWRAGGQQRPGRVEEQQRHGGHSLCAGLGQEHGGTPEGGEVAESERERGWKGQPCDPGASVRHKNVPEETGPPCRAQSHATSAPKSTEPSTPALAASARQRARKASPSSLFTNRPPHTHRAPFSASVRNLSPSSLLHHSSRSSSSSASSKNRPSAKPLDRCSSTASPSWSSVGSFTSLLSPKGILVLHIYRLSLWRHPHLVLIFGLAEGPCVFCGQGGDLLWLVIEYVTRYSLDYYFDTPRESASSYASMDVSGLPHHSDSSSSRRRRGSHGMPLSRGKDRKDRERKKTLEDLSSASPDLLPSSSSSSGQVSCLFRLPASTSQRDWEQERKDEEEQKGVDKLLSSLPSPFVMVPTKVPHLDAGEYSSSFFPGFYVSFYPWKGKR